jgi:hypothetical protein
MPPGNSRIQKSTKVLERMTAEACIAIARRVVQAHELAADRSGASAADQVAQLIETEVLAPARSHQAMPTS